MSAATGTTGTTTARSKAVCWSANRLDIFVVGTDSALWPPRELAAGLGRCDELSLPPEFQPLSPRAGRGLEIILTRSGVSADARRPYAHGRCGPDAHDSRGSKLGRGKTTTASSHVPHVARSLPPSSARSAVMINLSALASVLGPEITFTEIGGCRHLQIDLPRHSVTKTGSRA
jgi:hypothetical protein